MSVQGHAIASNANLTPASATFEAAAAATDGMVCALVDAFETLTTTCSSKAPVAVKESPPLVLATKAALGATIPEHSLRDDSNVAAREDPGAADTLPEQPTHEAEGAAAAVENGIKYDNFDAREAEKATAKEAKVAHDNWLELRARVESVDPRVFAFRDDPKYLQQCEEAKQRRTLAAIPSCTPAWH
jgi:hypothetical protein